ncbi:hypothetical protein [Streptomyces sp. NPDC055506]
MAMLAVLIPVLMLGAVLVLGRYEELLLPEENAGRHEPAGVPVPPASAAAAASPTPAGTPAPSP